MMIKEIIIYTLCFIGLFSSTVLLMTFFENMKSLKHPKVKRYPLVSILVPAFNEETSLRKTIDSLLNLDWPRKKLEIMVIDDGSTDKTLKIAKEYLKKGVSVFTKKNSGKADSLNFGLKRCKGEIVGALDADSVVMPDALKKMAPYFEKKKVMCVVPSVKVAGAKGILPRIQMIEFLSATFIRKAFSLLGGVPVTPGPFTLYKKEFFDKYGGYDTKTVTEDIAVALRIESKHFTIESVIDANVYTDPVNTLKKVYTQRLRWFKGFIDNILKYRFMLSPSYGNLGLFILPVSIFSIIVGLVAFGYAMTKLTERIIQNLTNLWLIDFDIWALMDFNFDLFLVNTGKLFILPAIALIVAASLIFIAKKYSKEDQPIGISTILFFAVYWAIYSVCWVSAAVHKLFKQKVVWGKE